MDTRTLSLRTLFSRFVTLFAPLFAVALGVAACDSSSGPSEPARIQVLVTDLPSDYIATADVYVTRVYLQGGTDEGEEAEGEENEAGRVDLFNDPDNPQHFELLSLQDGLTFELTDEVEVPAGLYGQLRFVVDMAVVTLAGDHEFVGGGQTAELHVPSGSSSGIKVNLVNDLVLVEGEVTTITVDIPVDDNFRIQGNPETPAGIQGISFVPTLHEIAREASDEESEG